MNLGPSLSLSLSPSLSLPLSLSISGLYDLVRHYFGPGKGGGVVEHLAPLPPTPTLPLTFTESGNGLD